MKKSCLLAVSASVLAVVAWTFAQRNATARIEVLVMTFNIRYDNHEDGQDSWDNRKESVCDILLQEAPDVAGLQEAKAMGVRLIMEHIENRSPRDPVVLTGDFNAEEDHAVIAFVKSVGSPAAPKQPLVDSFRAHHPSEKTAGTYHGFKGNMDGRKIDYIFASQDAHTLDSAILRTHRNGRHPSDHFPVTAHFQFVYRR